MNFLKPMVLLMMAGNFSLSSADAPTNAVARCEADPKTGVLTYLSWDTEGGDRAGANLLRAGRTVHVEERDGKAWRAATGFAVVPHLRNGGFDLAIRPTTAPGTDQVLRVVFPFDPQVSAVSVLPSGFRGDYANTLFVLPAVVSATGFGQMLVTISNDVELTSTLEGSRSEHWVDWAIQLPQRLPEKGLTLSFRPLVLPLPKGLNDERRWRQVRRSWFNLWQLSAKWGNAGTAWYSPPGVLANNAVSDPVAACLFMYADAAVVVPQIAPGIRPVDWVGRTLDRLLEKRTLPTGQVISYNENLTFLDSNPSVLIAAWDAMEAGKDEAWLAARIGKLEKVADYLAQRDIDGDGIIEALPSGNANTLHEPMRASCIWDCVNFGHKDAWSNLLSYRGLRCMADLEAHLKREDRRAAYTALADRLRGAYSKTFYNPKTGWLAGWISQDGEIHDYAFPFVNQMAIAYGLVEPKQAREILARIDKKVADVGYTHFDLGLPSNLVPVRRTDYLLGLPAAGSPKLEDGSDTLGQFCNGGVWPGWAFPFITAYYAVGEQAEGDRVLDAMLARLDRGDIANGGLTQGIVNRFPDGIDMFDWQGKTSGYEGMLTTSYWFLEAVALREPALRARLYRPLLEHAAGQQR